MKRESLPQRKALRLPEYDYSACGAYFITLCTYGRAKILSRVCRGDPCGRPQISLTQLGEKAKQAIGDVEELYGVKIERYVIMPDHIHMLLWITDQRATTRVAPTVGRAVGAYKSIVVHKWRSVCREQQLPVETLWQRGYMEHVIRNETDLTEVRRYIEENPDKWHMKHSL